ncbi:MAG: hypothetical protein ACLS8D_00395 [Clostridioides difficile]
MERRENTSKRNCYGGEEVLMIEESELMYGGTCINVGCIPSKSLIINGENM